MRGWTWATASPQERGEWVRRHLRTGKMSAEAVRDLFELTETGLRAIQDGDDWRPEHERPAVNLIEV